MDKGIIFIIGLFCILQCTNVESSKKDSSFEFPDQLSDWNLYEGELSALIPSEDLFRYELNSALFSDYAEKARFIRLPEGEKMTSEQSGRILFPDGSIIVKNFYYPTDAREPDGDRALMETRLLVKNDQEWEVGTYIWNEAQKDATLEILGGEKDAVWIDTHGRTRLISYQVPDNNDCKSCHLKAGEVKPIGPRLANMDLEINYGGAYVNQIEYLSNKGLLDLTKVNAAHEKMVDWQNPEVSLNARAMAYLDINCAHCHSEDGSASNTGLFLHYNQTDPFRQGVMKTPVSAAQGSGGYDYNIVPGHPERSILLYRMNSVAAGVAMPEEGRTLVHEEGVALIEEWINGMNY